MIPIALTPILWPEIFFVLLLAALFAGWVYRRNRCGPGRSGLGLVSLAVVCGPLIGLLFAGLSLALSDVHPLDVRELVGKCVVIGLIAGLIGGLVFGMVGLISREEPSALKPVGDDAKPDGAVWDRDLDSGP